ncbi:MAG: methyltransferase [Pseudomonadota bacterium]
MDLAGTASLAVVLGYLTLALELWLIPVPSVVSAVALMKSERVQGMGMFYQLRWLLPTLVNITVFAFPLIQSCLVLVATFDGGTSAGANTSGLCWPPGIVSLLGLLLIIGGRLLTVLVATAMRSQAPVNLMRGTLELPLRSDGLFQYSRNPGLLGMYLFALGILLLQSSAVFALGLCHYMWHMHRRVLMEEGYLRDRFGTAYTDYLGRTRRYV